MSVLTESVLRSKLRNTDTEEYEIERGVIVTPSARQYLQDRNIKLIYKDEKAREIKSQNIQVEERGFTPRYLHVNGGAFEKKPEHMTQLYGNKLVNKDHRRIVFRGKLDSLQAKILETQILLRGLNEIKVLKDLEEVLSYVRKILEAEVLESEFNIERLIGLNNDELRAHSHNPKKFIGTEHIIYPSSEMGAVVIALNALRAQSREVEIAGYTAFKKDDGESERLDISLALNRLSSCFYIMMLRYAGGKYK